MILELLKDSGEIIEEDEDLKIAKADFIKSEVLRLSFFYPSFDNEKELPRLTSNDFLGYAIIKKNYFAHDNTEPKIHESVIRKSRHDNNCIRGAPIWKCRVHNCFFAIEGYIYAQQNVITNVCAHVAIKTLISRYRPSDYLSYRQMNRLIGIDLSREPMRGLTESDMIKIIESAGVKCALQQRNPQVPLEKYIYGIAESGYPAIVVFDAGAAAQHAIPVIGHTFNEDTWVPRAESSYFVVGKDTKYIPSESWVDMFIVHDDNWGSNYCVPNNYFEDQGATVILPLPSNVLLDPIRAEVIGSDYLLMILPHIPVDDNPWVTRLMIYAAAGLLVIRPVLLTGQDYADHLKKVTDWQNNKITNLNILRAIEQEIGQEHIWMVELSVPELFSANKRKVGEVILKAEQHPSNIIDFSNFYLARLPGYFVLYASQDPTHPTFKFEPSGSNSHIELFGCEQI